MRASLLMTRIGAVFSAWQHENPLQRGAELKAALDRLNTDQLAQMVKRVAGIGDWEMQSLLAALMKQWVLKDGAAAAAWARPAIERSYTSAARSDRAVFDAWCVADPERAIALALDRPDAETGRSMMVRAIYSRAQNDPVAQIDRMAALPAGALRDSALDSALRQWADRDPPAALSRLDTLSPGAARDSALTTLLTMWAGKDPAAALAELSWRLEKGEIGRGRGDLSQTIAAAAAIDPARTLDWAGSLPGDLRDFATARAAASWAEKDPVAALDWAKSHGLTLDERLFLSGRWSEEDILNDALNSDTKKTVAWLRDWPAGAERDRLLGRTLGRVDPKTAREIFDQLSPEAQKTAAVSVSNPHEPLNRDEAIAWSRDQVTGPARGAVISSVVGNLAIASPDQIESVIAEYPAGADRDAALRGAAESVIWPNPGKGLPYAERIADPYIRKKVFRALAGSWLDTDAPAARAWLDATPELAPDVKAMMIRLATEN
ncbi:MAG: hypothetical protein ABI680_00890 [Chthoniobacteraceae bacterium]